MTDIERRTYQIRKCRGKKKKHRNRLSTFDSNHRHNRGFFLIL